MVVIGKYCRKFRITELECSLKDIEGNENIKTLSAFEHGRSSNINHLLKAWKAADSTFPFIDSHNKNDVRTFRDYNGKQYRKVEQIPKNRPSSDCRLQLACMKSELLVMAGQHTAVNTFPGLVHTARHTMRADNTRSR